MRNNHNFLFTLAVSAKAKVRPSLDATTVAEFPITECFVKV